MLPDPTIKAALLAGMALICATWLLAGYYFARRMSDLRTRATSISERYLRGQELLTSVRSQVLGGSVYVRDALLDPERTNADQYRAKLQEAVRAADQSLRQYVPIIDSHAERDRVARLEAVIDDFRTTVLNVLATDSNRWSVEARNLLRNEIMPKREGVIRVTEEAQALNRSAYVQQQNEIAALYRATQRALWGSFGIAVLLSLVIAALAATYVDRLERRIYRQHSREAENVRDLQRLSTKLITAQEEERRVIARELHDEVGQSLTAIKVELAVAQRAIDASNGPTHILDDARAISESALRNVRDLSHLLHPALLDDLGLSAAVDWYLKSVGKRHDLRVDLLQERMTERLRPETEAAAFRIVQEALTNVVRHAKATSCRVYLQRLTKTLLVTVEDDGVGFDPLGGKDTGTLAGLGLIGIRERVTRLGGTLRLESAAGTGTRLTVELPAWSEPAHAASDVETVEAQRAPLHEVLSG